MALKIYEGSDTSSLLRIKWSGSVLPKRQNFSRGPVLIRFVSDASINGKGFIASYKQVSFW